MGTWNNILAHISPTARPEDDEFVRRINEPGYLDRENVVPLKSVQAFNPRRVHADIQQLSVTISGKKHQRDELQREIDRDEADLAALQGEWLRETVKLGCFRNIEGVPEELKDTPPALPQEDEQ